MNILTFDIEEWFHLIEYSKTSDHSRWNDHPVRIDQGVENILSFLHHKKIRATFFCLGWIAAKYPEIIKKIAAYGHEIGTHSHMHNLVFRQSRKVFSEDLIRSIDTIASITGQQVTAYRAPGFSVTKDSLWAVEILIENGIVNDSSVFLGSHNHGGMGDLGFNKPFVFNFRGATLKEYPINTKQILFKKICFSGGGYFRLFPYYFINKFTATSDYTMAYFHYRDFDKKQPVLYNANPLRMFKTYYGINSCFKKFGTYVSQHDFVSVGEAEKLIDWGNAKKLVIKDNLYEATKVSKVLEFA